MVAIRDQAAGAARPTLFGRFARTLADQLPKGLYARALLIIITPIVLLQSIVAFVFMERHWETVTRRLSTATTRDIAMLIDVYENYPRTDDTDLLVKMARDNLNLNVQILPGEELPAARPKPFFDLLDRTLSEEISRRIGKPFWIDTVGRSHLVEIRIRLDDAVFRVLATRSQTYASNSHIFFMWMVGVSLVLLTVAILFLRNQIRPILRLADAAENFGKGHPAPVDFRPRGAREVRRAANAFMEMRDRIERQIEQRTTMLAGVSHDLRTILTRFKLQLALFDDNDEVRAMRADVDEMQAMLEDYLAFAKGGTSEEIATVNMTELLGEVRKQLSQSGKDIAVKLNGEPILVPLRRHAFKRALDNVVHNAVRCAGRVSIEAATDDRWLTIDIDDDGPGIPAEEREQVFRPFYRLDNARNRGMGGTGLGLTIARDIVRGHGGDISLDDSRLGGLRATIRVPV
jgi:two-component system osmolarity sensor histidine kinase EnvZ